jgi:excisionase family DNA binding protein
VSLEPSPVRQRRARSSIERVCHSVNEFAEATGLSRPTIYRMMASGEIKFVQLGPRMRKIPTTEYARLGFSST